MAVAGAPLVPFLPAALLVLAVAAVFVTRGLGTAAPVPAVSVLPAFAT
ncbi:MAG: hypothetical protein ACTHOD_11315 [Motilibacteraceae bacterium]